MSWISILDICKDGGIVKKILSKGEAGRQPSDLDEVLGNLIPFLSLKCIILRFCAWFLLLRFASSNWRANREVLHLDQVCATKLYKGE